MLFRSNGEPSSLHKWFSKISDYKDEWETRNTLMAAALEQAAHDKHLLLTAERSRHVELKYPEYVAPPLRYMLGQDWSSQHYARPGCGGSRLTDGLVFCPGWNPFGDMQADHVIGCSPTARPSTFQPDSIPTLTMSLSTTGSNISRKKSARRRSLRRLRLLLPKPANSTGRVSSIIRYTTDLTSDLT